jgi:tRNA(fMet)-specific endonuclease VapC
VSYLIDTTTLIETLRSKPPPALVRRLSQVPTRERWTSVITVSQILLAARQEQDARLMQNVVNLVASIRVAPYDLGAAQAFAKFKSKLAADVETDDVMIAAIAQSRNYTLVTRRVELFSRFVRLRLEDWTQ